MKRGTGHLIDIAPTLYDFAQAKYPSKEGDLTTNPLPGISLRQLLHTDKNQVDRQAPLFWERAGNKAVRYGKWKLVSLFKEGNKPQLYNIDEDRGENRDLADQYPEIVKDLEARYTVWAKENGVVDYRLLKPTGQFR
ncbi:hypothetical protein KUH03_42835 [Sphingobacterium sp. E70]|uniref:hypothetical protein n=1 Tax=Sphingobacterium sp. E70 TaxID=2853439 RepID=UPI00211C46E0|nr:hypothetical protein [Sphingobacterium sp. E70]ULT25438.1 hypothetical protein KUH03_42835 [Sphingobacterium sp. E70]